VAGVRFPKWNARRGRVLALQARTFQTNAKP
jgi:hypothetical protein